MGVGRYVVQAVSVEGRSYREVARAFGVSKSWVGKIVGRYRKAVSMWNVVAGLHTNSAFSLSFEQIIELTRLLVSQVKALLPNTRTLSRLCGVN